MESAPSDIVTSCRAEQPLMRTAPVLCENAFAPIVSTFNEESEMSSRSFACSKQDSPMCSSRRWVKRLIPNMEKLAVANAPSEMTRE